MALRGVPSSWAMIVAISPRVAIFSSEVRRFCWVSRRSLAPSSWVFFAAS